MLHTYSDGIKNYNSKHYFAQLYKSGWENCIYPKSAAIAILTKLAVKGGDQ